MKTKNTHRPAAKKPMARPTIPALPPLKVLPALAPAPYQTPPYWLIEKHRKTFERGRHCASDLEFARAVGELEKAGIPQMEMARIYGRQQTWFSLMSRLNALPDSLLDYLREDKVKTSVLIQATRVFGVRKTEKALQRLDAKRQRKGSRERIKAREIFELLEPKQKQAANQEAAR